MYFMLGSEGSSRGSPISIAHLLLRYICKQHCFAIHVAATYAYHVCRIRIVSNFKHEAASCMPPDKSTLYYTRTSSFNHVYT
jgi:hypothetical protein